MAKITHAQLLEIEKNLAFTNLDYFRKRVCDYHDFQDFHKQIDEILHSTSKKENLGKGPLEISLQNNP